MKYMGSKNRIAKYLLPIILRDRKQNQWYVEPFVGGANIIDKVTGNRIGGDYNKYLIEALKFIRDYSSNLPKNNTEINEEAYKIMKSSSNNPLKGYYGFALSYGGKWFGGWRRDKERKRDYVNEAYKNATNQSPKLKGVKLICCSYNELEIPKNSIIYCDPPYQGTTKYKDNLDYNKFWKWCRDKTKEGHQVFISEYNAPNDFKCVWSKEINSSLTKDTGGKKGTERLFIYKEQSVKKYIIKQRRLI